MDARSVPARMVYMPSLGHRTYFCFVRQNVRLDDFRSKTETSITVIVQCGSPDPTRGRCVTLLDMFPETGGVFWIQTEHFGISLDRFGGGRRNNLPQSSKIRVRQYEIVVSFC